MDTFFWVSTPAAPSPHRASCVPPATHHSSQIGQNWTLLDTFWTLFGVSAPTEPHFSTAPPVSHPQLTTHRKLDRIGHFWTPFGHFWGCPRRQSPISPPRLLCLTSHNSSLGTISKLLSGPDRNFREKPAPDQIGGTSPRTRYGPEIHAPSPSFGGPMESCCGEIVSRRVKCPDVSGFDPKNEK